MEQTSNQKNKDQLTTVIQETADQRIYTVEPKTDVKFVRKISGISIVPTALDSDIISVCDCLFNSGVSVKDTTVSQRKQKILSQCARIETYLRERRIPELIRFILAKIICHNSQNVAEYVEELLEQCMLFRSGHGIAPVLFEERHLQAVMKSFDPCNRGWLTAGQVRRAFTTLGLTPKSNLEVKTPTLEVLDMLRETQEEELLSLLKAGFETGHEFHDD